VLTLCVLVGAVEHNTWGLGEICNGFGRVRSVEILKAASWPEQVLADQELNLRRNGCSAQKTGRDLTLLDNLLCSELHGRGAPFAFAWLNFRPCEVQ
jgi:hypothetical protein